MDNFFNKTRLIAISVLCVFLVGLILYGPDGRFDFSDSNILISAIGEVVWSIFVVYLIHNLRNSDQPVHLGVWGFVWRGIVLRYLSMFLVALLLALLGFGQQVPSVTYTIAFSVLNLVFTVLLVWALFSSNRKDQLNWLVQTIRGY